MLKPHKHPGARNENGLQMHPRQQGAALGLGSGSRAPPAPLPVGTHGSGCRSGADDFPYERRHGPNYSALLRARTELPLTRPPRGSPGCLAHAPAGASGSCSFPGRAGGAWALRMRMLCGVAVGEGLSRRELLAVRAGEHAPPPASYR